MRILLLGANGQLGKELARQLPLVGNLTAYTRASLDITNHADVLDAVKTITPDVIVNAAAYTAVDKAEEEQSYAFAINADAVDNLAKISCDTDAWFIHYSTDYVFDGNKNGAYLENDIPNPVNVYGASKLAGENAINQTRCNHLIFRTTWVVGKDGNNFAKTILRLASDHESLRVISDQCGVPTSPALIARVTTEAIKSIGTSVGWEKGIYNLVPKGVSNWHEIAQTLINFANKRGVELKIKEDNIEAILTSDYPTSAQRPLNSLLNIEKISQHLAFELPNWKDDFLVVAADIIEELRVA
jgi:dTDP-4-dehydrorhamnose reductase